MNIEVGPALWLVFSICDQVCTQVFGKISGQQWPRKAKAGPEHAVNAVYRATRQKRLRDGSPDDPAARVRGVGEGGTKFNESNRSSAA